MSSPAVLRRWQPGSLAWTVALFVALLASASTEPLGADERLWSAERLFSEAVPVGLQRSADGTTIELARGRLIQDDGAAAGFSYRPNEERLSERIWIQKTLDVDDPRAERATLLVGRGGRLRARVNGEPLELGAAAEVGRYWQAYELPPARLKAGDNQIELYGEGLVWIARDDERAAGAVDPLDAAPPDRSARSSDGGLTWNRRALGVGENVDGEYYVRLFLDQHVASGRLTAPVVDLADLNDSGWAPPIAEFGEVRVDLELAADAAGESTVRVRTGTTPTPDAEHWSEWQTLGPKGGPLAHTTGRYLQADVELRTADPRRSPRLQRLKISANCRRSSDWTSAWRLTVRKQPTIVRSAIPFRTERSDHPELAALRRDQRLDEVLAGATTELDQLSRLAVWASSRWEKGHLGEAYPAWNAGQILRLHADGRPVGGFCQQYNLVFLQACQSLGFVGRCVSLSAGPYQDRIRSGHEVVEIWSNDHSKWIYIDGDLAALARDAATQVPLSLLELRDRQLDALAGRPTAAVEILRLAERRQKWESLSGFPPFVELRMIPRSNFLEQPSPLPLNQGMRGWFWTGHHVWTDARAPAALLYGLRTSRPEDWSWTLHQTVCHLAPTAETGVTLVHFETQSPNPAGFLVSLDDGPPEPSGSPLKWRLHPGTNRLVVRTKNQAGRRGPPSELVLTGE